MTAPTLPPIEEEAARTSSGPRLSAIGATTTRVARTVTGHIAALRTRPPWLLGPLAAVWAAAIGLAIAAVPLLIVWMATPQSGLTWLESLHVAGLLWAVAHGTPIVVAGITYSLLPWGLAVVPALLMVYAGGWAARTSRCATVRDIAVVVATASVGYGLIIGVIAQATVRPDARISTLDAIVHAVVLGMLAFGYGAVRTTGLDTDRLVPAWALATLRAGVVGALILLGIGAIAAAAALTIRVDDAVTLSQSLHTGFWGGLALLLLGVAYAPILIVWATAYVVGAGVMIGPAVTVSPFVPATAPTQLPPFPLLAALPQSASPLAWALPLAGVLAGVAAGLVIARRARADSRLMRLVMALGAAGVSATVLLVLSHLATGSLGDLRLANLGPSPTTVAVLAFVLVTLGAVPSAIVTALPAPPRLAVAEHSPADDTDGEDHDV